MVERGGPPGPLRGATWSAVSWPITPISGGARVSVFLGVRPGQLGGGRAGQSGAIDIVTRHWALAVTYERARPIRPPGGLLIKEVHIAIPEG